MLSLRLAPSSKAKNALAGIALAALALSTSACSHAATTTAAATPSASSTGTPAASLSLGYFANVTHSTPIVGVANGFYTAKLGSTKLTTQIFSAGPTEMTALLAGKLDAAYVGPSAALTAYIQSKGAALKIIAGAETGGAELVVNSSITTVADLKGKTIADPQLGNTQDVALRYWLKQQGYTTTLQGGGDVTIEPEANATTLTLFEEGKIQGAWVPEPWASRLVVEGGAHVLVDEKTLWPGGQFATTNLVVNTAFLNAHPQTVAELLQGQIAANAWIEANPAQAQTVINAQLVKLTGKALKASEITRSWAEETVTNDPIAASLQTELNHAVSDGLLQNSPIDGIYDLTPLNQALTAAGDPTISADNLGTQ
jgi:NitT/TauT family transport system substrate-binding protein